MVADYSVRRRPRVQDRVVSRRGRNVELSQALHRLAELLAREGELVQDLHISAEGLNGFGRVAREADEPSRSYRSLGGAMYSKRAVLLWVFAAGLVSVALGVSCSDQDQRPGSDITYLSSPELEAFDLPFSEAVRVGDMIFLSGQIGNLPGTTELVPGGIEEETRQALENIRSVLERHGSSMDRIAKCTIFLADISEWPRMNAVYATFFAGDKPARSAVAGSGLALGARVEIDCIAVMGEGAE